MGQGNKGSAGGEKQIFPCPHVENGRQMAYWTPPSLTIGFYEWDASVWRRQAKKRPAISHPFRCGRHLLFNVREDCLMKYIGPHLLPLGGIRKAEQTGIGPSFSSNKRERKVLVMTNRFLGCQFFFTESNILHGWWLFTRADDVVS